MGSLHSSINKSPTQALYLDLISYVKPSTPMRSYLQFFEFSSDLITSLKSIVDALRYVVVTWYEISYRVNKVCQIYV